MGKKNVARLAETRLRQAAQDGIPLRYINRGAKFYLEQENQRGFSASFCAEISLISLSESI
jgi:hypothetical protein